MGVHIPFDPLRAGVFVHLRDRRDPVNARYRATQLMVVGVCTDIGGNRYQVVSDPHHPALLEQLDPGCGPLAVGCFLLENIDTGTRHVAPPEMVSEFLERVPMRDPILARPWSGTEHIALARRLAGHRMEQHDHEIRAHLSIAMGHEATAREAVHHLALMADAEGDRQQEVRLLRTLAHTGGPWAAVAVGIAKPHLETELDLYGSVLEEAIANARTATDRCIYSSILGHAYVRGGRPESAIGHLDTGLSTGHPEARRQALAAVETLLTGASDSSHSDAHLEEQLQLLQPLYLHHPADPELVALRGHAQTLRQGVEERRLALIMTRAVQLAASADPDEQRAAVVEYAAAASCCLAGADQIAGLALSSSLPIPPGTTNFDHRKQMISFAVAGAAAVDTARSDAYLTALADYFISEDFFDPDIIGGLLHSSNTDAQKRGMRAIVDLLGRPHGVRHVPAAEAAVTNAPSLPFERRVELVKAVEAVASLQPVREDAAHMRTLEQVIMGVVRQPSLA